MPGPESLPACPTLKSHPSWSRFLPRMIALFPPARVLPHDGPTRISVPFSSILAVNPVYRPGLRHCRTGGAMTKDY